MPNNKSNGCRMSIRHESQRSGPQETNISSLADLQHLKLSNQWLGRPELSKVVLRIDGDPASKRRLERRIQSLFNECGCRWASAAFFSSFLIITTISLATSSFAWSRLATTFLIALFVGAIAKLVALWVSHALLSRELNALVDKFSPTEMGNQVSKSGSAVTRQ